MFRHASIAAATKVPSLVLCSGRTAAAEQCLHKQLRLSQFSRDRQKHSTLSAARMSQHTGCLACMHNRSKTPHSEVLVSHCKSSAQVNHHDEIKLMAYMCTDARVSESFRLLRALQMNVEGRSCVAVLSYHDANLQYAIIPATCSTRMQSTFFPHCAESSSDLLKTIRGV